MNVISSAGQNPHIYLETNHYKAARVAVIVIGGSVVALSAMHSTAFAIVTLAVCALACIALTLAMNKADLDDAKAQALCLITPAMNDISKNRIIHILGWVKASERPAIVEQVLRLITPGMDGHERSLIISKRYCQMLCFRPEHTSWNSPLSMLPALL
jgi:hypothetical protein